MDMRREFHETAWNRCRVGAATAFGRQARLLGLYATGSCRFSRGTPRHRNAVDGQVPRIRAAGVESQAAPRPHAQAHAGAGAGSAFLVLPVAHGVRLAHRVVVRAAGGGIDPSPASRAVPSALRQSGVGAGKDHAAETAAAGPRGGRAGKTALGWGG